MHRTSSAASAPDVRAAPHGRQGGRRTGRGQRRLGEALAEGPRKAATATAGPSIAIIRTEGGRPASTRWPSSRWAQPTGSARTKPCTGGAAGSATTSTVPQGPQRPPRRSSAPARPRRAQPRRRQQDVAVQQQRSGITSDDGGLSTWRRHDDRRLSGNLRQDAGLGVTAQHRNARKAAVSSSTVRRCRRGRHAPGHLRTPGSARAAQPARRPDTRAACRGPAAPWAAHRWGIWPELGRRRRRRPADSPCAGPGRAPAPAPGPVWPPRRPGPAGGRPGQPRRGPAPPRKRSGSAGGGAPDRPRRAELGQPAQVRQPLELGRAGPPSEDERRRSAPPSPPGTSGCPASAARRRRARASTAPAGPSAARQWHPTPRSGPAPAPGRRPPCGCRRRCPPPRENAQVGRVARLRPGGGGQLHHSRAVRHAADRRAATRSSRSSGTITSVRRPAARVAWTAASSGAVQSHDVGTASAPRRLPVPDAPTAMLRRKSSQAGLDPEARARQRHRPQRRPIRRWGARRRRVDCRRPSAATSDRSARAWRGGTAAVSTSPRCRRCDARPPRSG